MSWLNPLAWTGLLLLAVPVLIHLLARRSARVQRFPTLRFFDATPLLAVRRARLTDLPLLAVRMAVIAAAVAALAQPYWLTAERAARHDRLVTRVVVVDTSASMQRLTPAGEAASAAALREAAAAAEDGSALIVPAARLPAAVAGAAAWLDGRPGRRELVVISDFQLGALDSADLQAVPAGTGVRLHRVAVTGAPAGEWRTRHGSYETIARAEPGADGTTVEWERHRTADDDAGVVVLAGAAERAGALAARAAALASAPHVGAERPVVLLFPGAADYTARVAAARPPDAPWMTDAVTRMRRDPVLADAAGAANDVPAPDGFLAVTAGAFAAAGDFDGRDALLLLVRSEPGSIATAALIAATARALAPAPDVREFEPAVVSDDVLARWARTADAAVPSAAGMNGSPSDARWFWLLCLALIAVESVLRRGRRAAPEEDAA
jgi:hypothetical protein